MRNFLRSTEHLSKCLARIRQGAAAFVVGLGLGSVLVGPAVMALTIPPTVAPRQFPTQQSHYLRFTVNFNSCVLVANTCSVKVGAIPYNSYLVRAFRQIVTNFNSGT